MAGFLFCCGYYQKTGAEIVESDELMAFFWFSVDKPVCKYYYKYIIKQINKVYSKKGGYNNEWNDENSGNARCWQDGI